MPAEERRWRWRLKNRKSVRWRVRQVQKTRQAWVPVAEWSNQWWWHQLELLAWEHGYPVTDRPYPSIRRHPMIDTLLVRIERRRWTPWQGGGDVHVVRGELADS